MTAFAEMAIFAPMNKRFSGYATRFYGPAPGLTINYWQDDINVGVWIIVFGSVVVTLNESVYALLGENEFYFVIFKVLVLIGMIIACSIISLGGSPSGEWIDSRYWKDPGAFAPYLSQGFFGKFLGLWSCIVQAAFMFIGCEVTIWRIAFFYIRGVIFIGTNVPYTNDLLLGANKHKTSASDVVNAFFLTFTISFANSGKSGISTNVTVCRCLYGIIYLWQLIGTHQELIGAHRP
ncbi:Uncharacterized protein HZ326_22079 [Fusarium oxysporum f. sp. albedinis]|nr:Uncharacterized protein HZ326_22079 [Fusarium oxysporum f. sp. albedinis]